MSKQIIIIDSAEALAGEIALELARSRISKHYKSPSEVILSCLHPIEVPRDAEELVDKVREVKISAPQWNGAISQIDYVLADIDAAALITAHSRTVPRAMLDAVWRNGYEHANGKKDTDMAEIAEKFGYHAE